MPELKTSLALAPGAGTSYAAGPSRVTVKAGVQDTAGKLSVIEYVAAPGFPGPGKHVHPSFDEYFYVLGGRARFLLGDETSDLDAGGSVFASGDQPHTFANPFDEPLKLMIVCQPGGFDEFVAEVAAAAADGRASDPGFMPALWERHGMSPVD